MGILELADILSVNGDCTGQIMRSSRFKNADEHADFARNCEGMQLEHAV